jgi:hypothetical protein
MEESEKRGVEKRWREGMEFLKEKDDEGWKGGRMLELR